MRRHILLTAMFIVLFALPSVAQQDKSGEQYRSQVHFSPPAHWMNDPNGLVFFKGTYHLFYQHNPNSSVWGPMHWGHATSKDLIHWHHEPIALFPDKIGTIFSGSAVVDSNNTSGLGRKGAVPLVAMFTQHDAEGEKANKLDFQNQSLAYSLDNGRTWKKYSGNPVIKNPGIKDFRDPKVFWHASSKKWIVCLAAGDRILFYSSPNLKDWTKESEFGESAGAHGGVWECPDLFQLNVGSQRTWVLIVNINPGGPNKGSATQYFLGGFNGKTFTPISTATKWLDYGPDEYAGVTWSNTGQRKIFLGWMSNWLYANKVPTEKWRNSMTIPRTLALAKVNNDLRIASYPVIEMKKFLSPPMTLQKLTTGQIDISRKLGTLKSPCWITIECAQAEDLSLAFTNDKGETLVLGFDKSRNEYFIDRTHSGNVDFQADFAGRFTAPRFSTSRVLKISLLFDVSSVELFADEGLTVMTAIFFPTQPFKKISLQSRMGVSKLQYVPLNLPGK